MCNAVKKNVQVLEAVKRRTNDERRTNELIGPNFCDWSEFSIGPNSERLVRIPNDWSEFRTIGPNTERLTNDVATDVNASDVGKFVKVLNAQKKIGVD